MQPAYIVPAAEWDSIHAKLEYLVAAIRELQGPPPPPDDLLTVSQAAEYLDLTAEQLRRARRAGKIKGERLNELSFGFRRSVLDAYPRRYRRATAPA